MMVEPFVTLQEVQCDHLRRPEHVVLLLNSPVMTLVRVESIHRGE